MTIQNLTNAEKDAIMSDPYGWQTVYRMRDARFRLLYAGRGVGKSYLCATECLESASKGNSAWWIVPEQIHKTKAYRLLEKLTPTSAIKHNINWLSCMILSSGGSVNVISSLEARNNRGASKIDFAALDEAEMMDEDVYDAVQIVLSRRNGGGSLVGSQIPGLKEHWLRDLYKQKRDDPEWDCDMLTITPDFGAHNV